MGSIGSGLPGIGGVYPGISIPGPTNAPITIIPKNMIPIIGTPLSY